MNGPHRSAVFRGAELPLERARNVNFGRRLKDMLADREMTQSDLAANIWSRAPNRKGALVAKGRDRISIWVSGKGFPSHENLVKLARALNVEVSELAPNAELRAAISTAPEMTAAQSSAYPPGTMFLQIAQLLPEEIAFKIMQLAAEGRRAVAGIGVNSAPQSS